jgi:hypothetical protein
MAHCRCGSGFHWDHEPYFENFSSNGICIYVIRCVVKIKEDELAGACDTQGGNEKRIKILIGRPEGKRPSGRSWRRWEDNIRMDRRETECEGVDWIHLA